MLRKTDVIENLRAEGYTEAQAQRIFDALKIVVGLDEAESYKVLHLAVEYHEKQLLINATQPKP